MTMPSWRNWFTHCTRKVILTLGAVFAFVQRLDEEGRTPNVVRLFRATRSAVSRVVVRIACSRTWQVVHEIATALLFATKFASREISRFSAHMYRTQRRATIVFLGALSTGIIATSIFFIVAAHAEKEVHAFIMPSYASGEGVENPNAAMSQDLSMDAQFADFSLDYSSRVAFGTYAQPITVSTSTPASDIEAGTSADIATGTDATASVTEPATAPATSTATDTGDVPVQQAPVQTATTTQAAPSILDSVQSVIHAILPVVPAPTIDPSQVPAQQVTAPAADATTPSAPASNDATVATGTVSMLLRSTFDTMFGVKSALALDTPAADATPDAASGNSLSETNSNAANAGAAQQPFSEQVTDSSAANASDSVATSAPAVVSMTEPATEKPEDPDPYKVANCSLYGHPCHMLVLEGFGVSQDLSKYPVRNAQLMVSVAGRGAPQQTPDRIIFRAYHNGHWQYLGDQQVSGEFDNASRGGFLSFPLALSSWNDLADMKVAIEYDREAKDSDSKDGRATDAVMLLDAAWVDVGFGADATPDDLALLSPNVKSALLARDAAQQIRARDHLDLGNGHTIDFNSLMAQTPGARLRVALTSDKHAVLGSGEEYVGVTNMGQSPEHVRLSFHFPENGGRVDAIAHYEHNVPHKTVETQNSPIAYVCASGWQEVLATGVSDGQKHYTCADENTPLGDASGVATDASSTDATSSVDAASALSTVASTTPSDSNASSSESVVAAKPAVEDHICSSLSDDKTSCYSEVSAVGESEDTVYRRDFIPDAIYSGAFRDSENIFGRAIDALLSEMPTNILPTSVHEVSYSDPFDIEPGATKYFRVNYSVPTNSRGDYYVEAVAASGAYGLGHSSYDGSWTWRMPIDVGLPFANSADQLAVPISLDNMPAEFWAHVKRDGSDLRFTDEDATVELPYWIATWDPQGHSGLVWVRLPNAAGVEPRIYAYAGNPSALSASAPWAPFMTDTLTPRATLVGAPEEESDVTVTALAPHVRVSIDGQDERSLLSGETVLFQHVTNLQRVLATGPVAAIAHSVFARATMIPFGLSGVNVRIPQHATTFAMLPLSSEAVDAEVGDSSFQLATSTVFRMPLSGEESASTSVPAAFLATVDGKEAPLLPDADDDRTQLASAVVLSEKADSVRVTCADPEPPAPEVIAVPKDADGEVPTTVMLNQYAPSRAFAAYDHRGGFLASSTCGVALNGPFEPGTTITMLGDATSTPHGALFYAENAFDTRLLGADSFSRDAGSFGAQTSFGAPETVLPGEHRDFDAWLKDGRTHVNRFLSARREFSAEEDPTFTFEYRPQSNSFFRKLRSLFGMRPFTVSDVVLMQNDIAIPIDATVTYGANNQWTVTIPRSAKEHMNPGRLTLKMKIHEGGSTYDDAYDFLWGLLAMNFNKATYERGETMSISAGALSENGNTVCDAKLKLFVTTPASTTEEVAVTPSGKCDGNNLVSDPDYSASYTPADSGSYHMRLVRLDDAGDIVADESENITVADRMNFVIERDGPTRINPQYPYSMTLRVFAREGYSGKLVERIPGDFQVTDRGGATLSWADDKHGAMNATWNVDMKPGEVYQYTYTFNAPLVSPYIFLLGPATIGDGDNAYTEPRSWQIASDAAGKMIIYWDQGGAPANTDTTWACISCVNTDPLWQRYAMGSSTFGVQAGSATHTHTVTAAVSAAIYGAAANIGNNGTGLIYKDHTHTFTPTIAAASNLPLSTGFKAYRAANAGEVQVPANAMLFFDATPPSGWTLATYMEGTYPIAYDSIGGTYGTSTHNHTITGTTGAATGTVEYSAKGSGTGVSLTSHTHTAAATTTNSVSNDIPYVTYRMARANAQTAVPNGAIAMWDADPATGWLNLSAAGGIMSNRFVKAASTTGATGGSATHSHLDILGVALAASASQNTYAGGSSGAFGAPPTHTHTANYTNFSTVSNLPPYTTVVFAKRSVGLPSFTQGDYRFYVNVNDPTPVDPWPTGPVDIAQDTPPDDVTYRIHPGSIFRVRMDLNVQNATATASSFPIKLQYSTDGSNCANDLNWNDVGSYGSGAPLTGYTNSLVANGSPLYSSLLPTSTVYEAYNDSSTGTPFAIQANVGANSEWDFSLVGGSALASSTRYCLRAVETSGKVFSGGYTYYPNFLTNASPGAPSLNLPFDHAMFATTTPQLTFAASDAESDGEHYEVQISTDAAFGSTIVDATTQNSASSFTNVNNPTNKAPYTSGDLIQYQVGAGKLSNNTTYWWRVRAKDPGGSNNYGAWSTPWAMTINTLLSTSAWYQGTGAQYLQDTLTNVTVVGNTAQLTAGTTTGSMVTAPIVFNQGPFGTVWGSLVAAVSAGSGITFQVQYQDSNNNWQLVPDALIPNNSTGLGTSTSLTNVDPHFYPTLRFVANFNNSGSQTLNSWTVNWAFKTLAPVITQPFSHAKTATTSPTFYFSAIDPQNYNVRYQFQWGTDPTFAASSTCNSDGPSQVCGSWKDSITSSTTGPFASGHAVAFVPNAPLTNGVTYYYRVKGMGVTAGVWSFWSDIRAITVDTTITYATWFQTMTGQFNMDTLSGTYTANDSVFVATTSDKVLITYGIGSDSSPHYRIYQNSTLGPDQTALSISSTLLWATSDNSLTNDQFILGTMGADLQMRFQVLENGVWSRMFTMPASGPSSARRSFDVAYESKSGRALAVACNGLNASYAIFDGSSWGTAQTLTTGFSQSCEQIKLASNPTKNELALLVRDTGSTYKTFIWNGSTWGSTFTFTGYTSPEPAHFDMALEYEQNSGHALAIVPNGTNAGFAYSSWNGTSWGAAGTYTTLGGAGGAGYPDQLDWASLKRDPASNNLIYCGVSKYSTTDDGSWLDFLSWNGTSFVGAQGGRAQQSTWYPYTRHGQLMDCVYETKAGRTGRVMQVADESWEIADGSATYNRSIWDSLLVSAINSASGFWQSGDTTYSTRIYTTYPSNDWNAFQIWTSKLVRASATGNILATVLSNSPTLLLGVEVWNGSTWSALTNLGTPSVASKPFGQPFDAVAQDGLTTGRIFSPQINYSDGQAPAWRNVQFNQTVPGGTTAVVSVEYYSTSTGWSRIPDAVIPGNSVGTSTSPIDLSNVNVNTYGQIRLRDNFTCNGFSSCPQLNDWAVTWSQGLAVSGKARDNDRSTVITGGTVSIAVNGVLQNGKTATIDGSGNWSIPGVNYRSGDVVTAWISDASNQNRAAAVARYGGSGSLSGMELSRRWLTVGDTTQSGVTIANSDIGMWDYSAAATTTVFYDVDGSNNLSVCAAAAAPCADASLAVISGTTWRTNQSGVTTNTMYSLTNNGTIIADGNTYKVAGNWKNTSIFSPGTSLVDFDATSSAHTIDSTGASQYKFNDVLFGDAATTATWSPASQLYTLGSLTLNYGTLSPGAQAINIEKNLNIGGAGIFSKGSATTTFLGSSAATWSDATAGQDIGIVAVSGSPKNLTLASNVRASSLLITPGDGLSLSVNTLALGGSFTNTGNFTPGTGTLLINASSTAVISTGGASLNNLTVATGTVSFVGGVATTTGDILVQGGSTTFPATIVDGGSFTQTGGAMTVPTQLTLNSSALGKTVSTLGALANVTFAGSGSYGFGAIATTTGNFVVSAGTVTLPSTTLAVGGNFTNTGSINANGGAVYMNGASQSLTLGGAQLSGITVASSSITSFADTNATTTGSVIVNTGGTLNFPNTGSLSVGGSFINNGTANANASLLTMTHASGPASLQSNGMVLSSLNIVGAGAFTMLDNVRVSANCTFASTLGSFTATSGKELRIDGFFTNAGNGANETWTGSTLHLDSGATMAINAKTANSGNAAYGTLLLDGGTAVRMWNAQANIITTNATSSVYAQNWGGTSGLLRIYGTYNQNGGTAYWDANTDFDGTALGSSARQANIVFASSSVVTFASSSILEMIGTSTASTSLTALTNLYSLNIATSTWKSQYASVRGLTNAGVNITGSSSIPILSNTSFLLDVTGGSNITLTNSVINANAGAQYSYDSFGLGLAASGKNVTELTATANYIRFKLHSGNIAGEAFDNDASGNPGEVRWDDSNYVISISGTVYADAGATTMGPPVCDGATKVVTVQVSGGGSFNASCNAGTGQYTVSGVSFSGETVMSVYLKGAAQKAVTVTRGASTNLSGIDLYQDRVILRHEDVLPMTNAKLSGWTAANDAGMIFTISGNDITMPADKELWIWTNKTYAPGGNVNTGAGNASAWGGQFHLAASSTVLNVGAETYNIGGNFKSDVNATFVIASSTVNMSGTNTKTLIAAAPMNFWNFGVSGVGGNIGVYTDISVLGALNVSAGTLMGTANITANSGISGNGTVAMTSGAVSLPYGGNLGGTTPWSFNNLTLGDGVTIATTTAGSATTTVSGVLSINTNHAFNLAAQPLVLSGAGTPLVMNGNATLKTTGSTVSYTGTGATNVTNMRYNNLAFNGAGTYALPTMNLVLDGAITVASGTVSAATNNTFLQVGGDVNIGAQGTLIGSAIATTTVAGNWTNAGTFTSSLGVVQFIGGGSKTVNAGASPFGTVDFNDPTGTWTIAQNATATVATLSSVSGWTLASGKTLAVTGNFINRVGAPKTTWTGSTLYLNTGTTDNVNVRVTSGVFDSYGTIKLGPSTQAILWNSTSSAITTVPGAGLVSFNDGGVLGTAKIYGDYVRNSGTEYWDYANDWDGTPLGTPRKANVQFVNGATASYLGTSILDITGTAAATTTVRGVGGAFGLTLGGASTSLNYFDISGANATGTLFTNSVAIARVDNGMFSSSTFPGSLVSAMGTAMAANPLLFWNNDGFFGTTTAGSYNITATGTMSTTWFITGHYGGLAGEAHDNDPGGDPGYIHWDDSSPTVNISGKILKSDGVTPSAICNGSQDVALHVSNPSATVFTACAGDGSYSFSGLTWVANETFSVYIATSTATGTAVALEPHSFVNDQNVYENTVIVRNEFTSAITNANLGNWDKASAPKIPYSVSGGNITLDPNTKLLVWANRKYTPGGNVTLSGNSGDVELRPTANWQTGSGEQDTIGGSLAIDTNAVYGGPGEIQFTSSAAGKSISASTTASLPSLRFNGAGTWTMTNIATTTGNVNIMAGSGLVTLPATPFAVGGSFTASSSFNASGATTTFFATTSGQTIKSGGNSFANILFAGSGGWTFQDAATTTGSLTIASGAVTFSASTTAIGGDFQNLGGSFTSGGGTLRLYGTGARTFNPGGSFPNNVTIAGNGTFTMPVIAATTTGDLLMATGTLALPTAGFDVGGTFKSTGGLFSAGATSTVRLYSAVTGKLVNPGASTFNNLIIDAGAGGYTIEANATTTGSLTLKAASAFVVSPNVNLGVLGTFSNAIGGTWASTTLSIYGTSTSAFNTKTASAVNYNVLNLGANVDASAWNSSFATVTTATGASLYSQNDGNVSGALKIYGAYGKTSGADYWSAATDFDGTNLGSARAVTVKFAPGASATYASTSALHMVGTSGMLTSLSSLSGNYSLRVQDNGTFEANYIKLRNTDANGIQLAGTTTILAFGNSDLATGVTGGSIATIDGTVIDTNTGSSYPNDSFATDTAQTSGYNITLNGTSTNAVYFTGSTGNIAGEAFDNNDGGSTNYCGAIRWDDSACQFVEQRGYEWRNDDGGEAVPDAQWYGGSASAWPYRERVSITNSSGAAATNVAVLVNLPYKAAMQADFRDVRFTSSDGLTLIPFWLDRYVSTNSARIWVKVPSLPANGVADVYAYYGNSSATSASSMTNTFTYGFDADSGLTGMSGDTGAFTTGAAPALPNSLLSLGSNYLKASNVNGWSTDMANTSAGVGQGMTIRETVYIDGSQNDDACLLFGAGSPISKNWGLCLSPQRSTENIRLVKDAIKDGYDTSSGDISAEPASTNVTIPTGWYDVRIDWQTGGTISATVTSLSDGSTLGSISATDSYAPGSGIGFSYWYQHAGWDNITVTPFVAGTPTAIVQAQQGHGGASWQSVENVPLSGLAQNTNVRLRLSVRNTGTPLTSQQLRLEYAYKGGLANCESVSSAAYQIVPSTASPCSGDVCMSTSTKFTNNAATTPLLSSPKSVTFVPGMIVQDPSNMTNSFNIPNNTFTEVEYALHFTSSAYQPAYCFRVTNNGTPLVSYSHVAQASVLHPPQIQSDWSWQQPGTTTLSIVNIGSTTAFMATGTVTDYSGWQDIATTTATATMYRSGVGESCSANANNCYTGASTTCSFSSCAVNSCVVSCTANVQYFADPTDLGTYAGQTWNAAVTVKNIAGQADHKTANATLQSMQALSVDTPSIDFGSLYAGSSTQTGANPTTTVRNVGNASFSLTVQGADLVNGGSSLSTGYEKVASSSFNYTSCTICSALSSTTATSVPSMIIPKPVSTAPVTGNLYWGISIPYGILPKLYNGSVTIFTAP